MANPYHVQGHRVRPILVYVDREVRILEERPEAGRGNVEPTVGKYAENGLVEFGYQLVEIVEVDSLVTFQQRRLQRRTDLWMREGWSSESDSASFA
ncbi:hypothetical protein VB773_13200 [Haloarculaceae archaeon H-GB2-1]|nr:hypothetical protein [Haloarculaceae archaeon H-GB2-1]